MDRFIIQWTKTAQDGLANRSLKVRRGLMQKIAALGNGEDGEAADAPARRLNGPLRGYYRVCYSRFRAVYSIAKEHLPSGDALVRITVHFIASGVRDEVGREDVFRFAQKLIDLGVLEVGGEQRREEETAGQSENS